MRLRRAIRFLVTIGKIRNQRKSNFILKSRYSSIVVLGHSLKTEFIFVV